MHPEIMTESEVYDYISELCYGKKHYFLIAHVVKTDVRISVGEPTESFEAVNELANIQIEEELRNSRLEGREINLVYEIGNTWIDNSYPHVNTVEELINFI